MNFAVNHLLNYEPNVGPYDFLHWNIGSLDHWIIGSLDHWIIGSLKH